MPAGKEAQPECILQTAKSGRLNCSCNRSRDLTAFNPAVPEVMKIAALAVSTARNGNMSFAFSKSVPIAPAKKDCSGHALQSAMQRDYSSVLSTSVISFAVAVIIRIPVSLIPFSS